MDQVGFAVYRLLGAALKALPIEWGFRLGAALGWIGYYLAGPYRRLVLRNLTIALGHEKQPAGLRQIARQHFATLGANLFSSVKLPHLSEEELLSRVTVEGLETIDAGIAAGRGFVMIASHIGSWEMFTQLTPRVFRCPVGGVFQALGNPHIDAAVRRDRAQLGFSLFERKEGFTKAMQFIREGGAVGVLVDQHAGDAGLWCPFFNRLASTSTLAATLALRTGAWLVPAAAYTDGIARWRCVFGPRIEADGQTAEVITMRINEVLEAQIREQPADWFWVHNRWKTPKPKFLLATYKRGVSCGAGAEHPLQPFRIVVRGSNWLGDAIMSIPAVRAIKRGRPDAHVTILTPAKLADVWRRVEEVDEVLTIERGESVFAVARKLRRKFEAAIILPNSLRTALEPWLAGIPRRVGSSGHHRKALLDQVYVEKKKKEPEPPPHQEEQYLALAKFVGADISNSPTPNGTHGKRTGLRPTIGVCPGAEYGPAKRWLPERFAETMRTVHVEIGCEWKVFGVEKDRPIADAILAAADIPATDLVGKTTLSELMEHLASCDLLLTNDTGTMHLAAFLGVPTVALFGSTEHALTGPRGPAHRIVRHHVECSPCFLRECPIDFRCMHAIEVSEVVAAVHAQLALRT
ncbi:MAG TPA: lipopolysaccharide heptosyltransferase II [Chthoniobacteraceae bacterium]|nr:lipopolysaccharide heptosyltransferase II [Chthoniobacteraceae bacterium]